MPRLTGWLGRRCGLPGTRGKTPSRLACHWVSALILGVRTLSAQQGVRPIQAREAWRIESSREDLSAINLLAIGRDGSVVVGQPQDKRVVFFSANGKRLGAVGRRGAGPGEFQQLLRLGWKQDSLWVFDGAIGRITLIGPTHQFISSTLFPPGSRTSEGTTATGLGPVRLLDGDSMLASGIVIDRGSGTPRPVYLRTTTTGSGLQIVVTVPANECNITVERVRIDDPACARPLAASSPDGERVAYVSATPAEFAASTFRLVVVSVTGTTLIDRRIQVPAVQVQRAAFDSAFKGSLTENGVPDQVQDRILGAIGRPRVRPPATALMLGRDGSTWVGQRLGAGTRWLQLDSRGLPVGFLVVPSAQRVMAVSRDHLWVVESDMEGSESVVQLNLSRPR